MAVCQFIRPDDNKGLYFFLALPFSRFLYRINRYTQTPVNTVWFDAFLAILLGCLAFAGTQAINAVFALSVTALYVAYSIPIGARIVSKTNFQPGPFTLGIWVSGISLQLSKALSYNLSYRVFRLQPRLSYLWYSWELSSCSQ